MDYLTLAIICTLAALAHLGLVATRTAPFTMAGWFVLAHWIMTIGTLSILSASFQAAREYAYVVTIPYLIFITTSIVAHHISFKSPHARPTKRRTPIAPVPLRPHIVGLLIASILVTLLYYRAVGYNTFLVGAQNLITGGNEDYTSLRLDSYDPNRYLFPGYVNQFKNAILPALTVVIAHRLYHDRHSLRHLVTLGLAALSIVGLLGTGQRGAFVQFVLILTTFLFFLNRRRFGRRALLAVAVAAPPVLLSTFLLGRSAGAREATSFAARVKVLGEEVLGRVFRDNQYSGVAGFLYTDGQPVQNGREWFVALQGILPGNPGSDLSQQVFASIYGSTRGTAPLSLWGSVQYNWGWAGLMLFPILLAVAYRLASTQVYKLDGMNALSLIGMSGCFVLLGNWVAGGPEYVVNSGAVTYAILWWLGRVGDRKWATPLKHDPTHLALSGDRDPLGAGADIR